MPVFASLSRVFAGDPVCCKVAGIETKICIPPRRRCQGCRVTGCPVFPRQKLSDAPLRYLRSHTLAPACSPAERPAMRERHRTRYRPHGIQSAASKRIPTDRPTPINSAFMWRTEIQAQECANAPRRSQPRTGDGKRLLPPPSARIPPADPAANTPVLQE